jgi:hypothetical protein
VLEIKEKKIDELESPLEMSQSNERQAHEIIDQLRAVILIAKESARHTFQILND